MKKRNIFSRQAVNFLWVLLGLGAGLQFIEVIWAASKGYLGFFSMMVVIVTEMVITGSIYVIIYKFLIKPCNETRKLFKHFIQSGSFQELIDQDYQIFPEQNEVMQKLDSILDKKNIIELSTKHAELLALQNQINPHFLYNTLDSINWIALTNGQDEISEMITALSDTFRLSLMKNNSPFTELNQEIRYIQSYLVLQKFRYEDRLTYDFDLPEPLPLIFIPRFILQPIIENALKHGISQLEHGGRLVISISVDDFTHIIIRNDGTNINLEKMQRLLAFDPNDPTLLNFENEGYGVQNINRRIKLICGANYGLTYKRTDSQTICTILLPVRTSGL